jgi:hypothetical protein
MGLLPVAMPKFGALVCPLQELIMHTIPKRIGIVNFIGKKKVWV